MGRGPGVRIVGPDAIQLDFRWKGQRPRPRIRLSTTKANLEYCRRWKRRIEDEIALGTFVWEKHFPNHANPCPDQRATHLREFGLAYIELLQGRVQPETLKEYRQCVEIVSAGLHNPALERIDRAKFRTWVAAQQLSKARIDNLLTPIRGALKQAVEDGVIAKNPLEGFEVRRIRGLQTDDRIDPFTPEEIAALSKTELGQLWVFWAYTGIRSGEVIGLRWGDVDLEGRHIHIRRAVRRGREKTPKTAAGARSVLLLAPARAALAELDDELPQTDPVFRNPHTGGGWHEAKALNRAFARACKKAEVRRRYVYQLRHTFATWALSAGEPAVWIAKQMGHEDVQVIYDHYAKWMPRMDPKVGSRMLESSRPRRKRRAA